jgi:TolA-binding protein
MPIHRPGSIRPQLLVPILLLCVAGCAYYNTFYLAKRYYKDARKEQEKSVSGAVAAGASARYDQVIRQCMKVITEYPKSKYVDDALYLMGASLYGKGDYAGAIRRLDELETKFPKSPFIADARVVKGLAHYRRKNYETADSVLVALSTIYPKHNRRWEIYFYEGESRFAQRDYPGALPWYRRAIDVAGERREKSEALRRTGDALFESDRMDSAQTVYGEALRVEERPGPLLDIALKRTDALRNLKRYEEAANFIGPWRAPAAEENREGEVLLRIYELQGLQGRPRDAIKGYQELVENYPNTNVAYESQFQIGYLYETALNDLDAAAREYDKMKAMGNNSFAVQATRRSQSLATLKQFRTQMAADTTGAGARTAFRLAEVYYFELGKTDSALVQYQSVETVYPKSVYAPKSAFARLWIAAYDRSDTTDAMRLTDQIASRYRGTRYAESALYLWKRWSGRTDTRTALFDSLMAHPDTSGASMYAAEEAESGTAQDGFGSASPGAAGAPVMSAPDSGYQVPEARMEQLRRQAEALQRQRETARRMRQGLPPVPADTTAAPADTTRRTEPPPPPPPSEAPPQSSSPPPGSAPSPAPADTTRRSTPSDTTGTKR